MLKYVFALCCYLFCTFLFAKTPCDELRGKLDATQMISVKENIARHSSENLDAKKINIIDYFTYNGWSVIHEDDGVSDKSLLIYDGDIFNDGYIAAFSGVAKNETEMTRWVVNYAPGMHGKLILCFSWYAVNYKR
ncbi:TPA: hypothetical protein RY435_004545 [Escherichia albertii]|uniref:hypothetical protein n=1 Tax=Escherichia albertii TaxID=208962 RepID=UPI000744381E|nr:hypothetical protein [Escherichia albertii]HEB1530862.1 hypothetical protein [Escherichia albertii]